MSNPIRVEHWRCSACAAAYPDKEDAKKCCCCRDCLSYMSKYAGIYAQCEKCRVAERVEELKTELAELENKL